MDSAPRCQVWKMPLLADNLAHETVQTSQLAAVMRETVQPNSGMDVERHCQASFQYVVERNATVVR